MTSRSHHEVIIIGAGLSGLSAACHLLENGVNDIIILEARDRIGGRIAPAVTQSGKRIHLGANWLHGANIQRNPLYQYALRYGLIHEDVEKCPVDFESQELKVFTSDGRQISPDAVKLGSRIADKVINSADGVYEKLKKDNLLESSCMSLDAYFEKEFQCCLQEVDCDLLKDVRAVLNGFKLIEATYACDDLYKVSTEFYGSAEEISGGEIWLPFDMLTPMEAAIDKGKVILNQKVTKIIWGSQEDKKVLVEVENGENSSLETWKANFVISTLPVGVMKLHHSTMFVPHLPLQKVAALMSIGAGQVGKYLIEWNTTWRESGDRSAIILARTEEEIKDGKNVSCDWKEGIAAFHPVEDHDVLMICWIAGDCAKKADCCNDDEVKIGIGQVLRKFLNNPSIPDPDFLHRHCWTTDEFCFGGYSYPTMTMKEKDVAILGAPLPSEEEVKLLFAGEATSTDFWGFLHGAYLTGIREANRVLEGRAKE